MILLKAKLREYAGILKSDGLVLLISSFLFISSVRLIFERTMFYNPFFLEQSSLFDVLIFLVPSWLVLVLIRTALDRRFTLVLLMGSSVLFAVVFINEAAFNSFLNFGVAAILFYISYYVFKGGEFASSAHAKISDRHALILLFTSTILVGAFLSITTVLRHRSFMSFNFDFGIFAQMYHYMAETGEALVTSERDKLLSHFAVHISPIYYVFLPVYMLFRSPDTLLVIQGFAIASAAIPVYFICKNRGFENIYALAAAHVCLIYPPFFHGAYFDFHENVFLCAIILWLIYFYEKHQIVPIVVFTILTLSVKEDAALYVLFLSAYFMFSKIKKIRVTAIISFVSALAYFVVCMKILEHLGTGPMVTRFNNYMTTGDEGFYSVIENILYNPAHFVNQIFNSEKFAFVINMVLPLMFLPFFVRKPKHLLLIFPMLVINIMPNYTYQYRIGYQYVYGSGALLIYLFIINFSKIRQSWRRQHIAFMCALMSLILVIAFSGKPVSNYIMSYINKRDDIEMTNACLQRIPEDAEVTANTYLLPHLAEREILYMYPSKNDTEYLVLDIRHDNLGSKELNALYRLGYELVDAGGYAQVYRKIAGIKKP